MNCGRLGPASVGILVKTYPKISETFILEEILGLERRGLALHIFALHRPSDQIVHAACARVRAPVDYISLGWRDTIQTLRAHLRTLRSDPLRYLAAAVFALRVSDKRSLIRFVQAGCLVDRMRAMALTHVHAHFVHEPGAVAEVASRMSVDVSYSLSAHAKDIYLSSDEMLRRRVGGARFTVTCTEHNRQYLASRVPAGARLTRMYHGVDLDRFKRDDGTIGAGGSAVPLVLAVGRLRAKKGFGVLIDACRLLREGGVELRCEIVGYGEEQPRLQAQIAAAGLQSVVELPGKLPQDEVIKRYRAARVFALPCRLAEDGDRDGIPNVLLEAMAMRVPVISTPVSGIPELVEHGRNGLLVPANDPVALAGAIRNLIDDPAYGQRLAHAGRRTVQQHFCNDVNLQHVHDLLLGTAGSA
jgi:glycosyltransferase involved in cell wall biosynthesis